MQSTKPRLANQKKHLSLPILLSVLVHTIILFFIFFTQKFDNKHEDSSIETSLVTPEQFSNIQNKVKQKELLNHNADTANTNALDRPQDPAYIDYATNQSYQAMQANKYSQSITKEAENLVNPYESAPIDKQFEDIFLEASIANKPQDDVVIDSDTNRQAENIYENKNVKTTNDKNILTTTAANTHFPANINNSGNISSFSQVTAKIQRYLDKDSANNVVGKSITVIVEVYENGNIKNVKAVKGDEELFKKVSSAVYSAEPLPIDVNDSKTYPTIELTLHGIK